MDGKALAARVRAEVAGEVAQIGHVGLATVLVGDDPASDVYIRAKHTASAEVGIEARDLRLSESTTEAELLGVVAELNADDGVDGILVQLPLAGRDRRGARDPRGRPDQGRGRLPSRRTRASSTSAGPRTSRATALGVIALLDEYEVELAGAARGRRRAQRHRREAGGDAPARPPRDRDDLPFAHARPRGRGRAGRRRRGRGGHSRPRPGDWIKDGARP